MRHASSILLTVFMYFLLSCSGDKLNIAGDEEAIVMAESMIHALGGKKNWSRLKSVYIRTVSRDMLTGDPYIFEEWINLEEPKFMNRRVTEQIHYFQIVDRNDGWTVRNQNVALMQPGSVTEYLNWHEDFFMRNLEKLARGGDGIEVKLSDESAFDMYNNGRLSCRFSLNEESLPKQYMTSPDSKGKSIVINIKEWGEYKGYKYPLVVTGVQTGSYYRTDYWDAGMLDAESAFDVTFDPYQIAKSFK